MTRLTKLLVPLLLLAAPGLAGAEEITVYSGRGQKLVGEVIKRFSEQTGIKAKVRYGDSAELAATILEEGKNSPADLFFSQDAGALGALASMGLLIELPGEILDRVEPRFRSDDGFWVGTSGRARVVVYDTRKLKAEDLPASILAFTEPQWRGRIGWAPTNGSFQAFVTGMRRQWGEEATEKWLRGILANKPRVYPKNSAIVAAVGRGEVEVGFVNHYYLFRFLEERGDEFPARNHYLSGGDPGALINVAGAGILKSSKNRESALAFVRFLLSEEAQNYFSTKTYEYALVGDMGTAHPLIPPMSAVQTPDMDLSKLEDLEGTLALLQDVGALD